MASTQDIPQAPTKHEDYTWYQPDSNINDSTVTPSVRSIFETYSSIPPSSVIPHIQHFRRAAFSIYPFPCLGELRFLDFSISRLPSYPKILSLLKSSPTTTTTPSPSLSQPLLLDIGCCLGQDLRKLAVDGVPTSRLYGAELRSDFVTLGYDLFRDKDTFQGKFIIGDALGDEKGVYEGLKGMFDVVHAASFLHLFDWEGQVEMTSRIVGLCKDKKGVMVVGRQVGSVKAKEVKRLGEEERVRFRHDEETWRKMWEEVGEKTGTKWEVVTEMKGMEDVTRAAGMDTEVRIITFEVTRVE